MCVVCLCVYMCATHHHCQLSVTQCLSLLDDDTLSLFGGNQLPQLTVWTRVIAPPMEAAIWWLALLLGSAVVSPYVVASLVPFHECFAEDWAPLCK